MFTSILVGTDGSETAQTAVRRAIELAAGLHARLQIVSAYEPVADQRLRGGGGRLDTAEDVQWLINPHEDAVVLLERARGEAKEAGVAEEQSCDLVVVGNKGMTGAKRFLLGSVPNKVSHHAPCSVLIVRTSQ